MALSGSVTTTSSNNRSVTLSWSATQNIATNQSTISWTLKGSGSASGYVVVSELRVKIDGGQAYYRDSLNHTNCYNGTLLASGTTTITHNNDGARSFSVSVEAGIYQWTINCSGSNSFALDTIPRASVPTLSVYSLNMGNSLTLSTNRKSSSFTHHLWYNLKLGDTYLYYGYNNRWENVAGSQTITLPENLATYIPNNTSVTCEFVLRTFSGSTQITPDKSVTCTLNVPATTVPSVGTPTLVPINSNLTVAGWNIYLQGYSACQITASASGVQGSTIKSFKLSGDYNITKSGTSFDYTGDIFGTPGTKNFTLTVTDSRGRTATTSASINVIEYSKPILVSFNAVRCDSSGNESPSGTYLKASYAGGYNSVDSKNSVEATIQYKLSSSPTWSEFGTYSGPTGSDLTNTSITFDADKEYNIKATITDLLSNSDTRYVNISTIERIFNIAKYGNGLAVGKMSSISSKTDTGKFEVGWATDFDKDVNIDGKLNVTGSIDSNINLNVNTLSGGTDGGHINFHNLGCTECTSSIVETSSGVIDIKATNGLQINDVSVADFVVEQGTSGIWTYRKWNNGTAECWGMYTGTKDITTALGTWFDSVFTVNYPFTFATAPFITVDGGSNDTVNFARTFNTATLDKASIILYAPSSQSGKSVHVSIYAKGNWK